MFNLIAGPCVIESEELVMQIAEQMKNITNELGIPYTFKASFDKANRTSFDGFRGPGIDEGLRILQKVKDTGKRYKYIILEQIIEEPAPSFYIDEDTFRGIVYRTLREQH